MADVKFRPEAKQQFAQGRKVHWSWGTQWGLETVINLDKGIVDHNIKGTSLDEYVFDGFTSFKVHDNRTADSDAKRNIGLTPHVTEGGFCSDGCFRVGTQGVEGGIFKALAGEGPGGALPFKAVMTDASFYDGTTYLHGNVRTRALLVLLRRRRRWRRRGSPYGRYYAQGSYPLNDAARCDADETAQCMFAIDGTTGSPPSTT